MEISLLGFYHRFYLVRFEQRNELSFLDAKDHMQFERIFGKLEFLEYAYLCSSSIFSTHEKQVSVEEAKCQDLLDWIGAYNSFATIDRMLQCMQKMRQKK